MPAPATVRKPCGASPAAPASRAVDIRTNTPCEHEKPNPNRGRNVATINLRAWKKCSSIDCPRDLRFKSKQSCLKHQTVAVLPDTEAQFMRLRATTIAFVTRTKECGIRAWKMFKYRLSTRLSIQLEEVSFLLAAPQSPKQGTSTTWRSSNGSAKPTKKPMRYRTLKETRKLWCRPHLSQVLRPTSD